MRATSVERNSIYTKSRSYWLNLHRMHRLATDWTVITIDCRVTLRLSLDAACHTFRIQPVRRPEILSRPDRERTGRMKSEYCSVQLFRYSNLCWFEANASKSRINWCSDLCVASRIVSGSNLVASSLPSFLMSSRLVDLLSEKRLSRIHPKESFEYPDAD